MLALITFIVVHQYKYEREQLIHKSLLGARAVAMTVDKDLDGVKAGLYALASSSHLQSGDLKAFHRQSKEVLSRLNADNIYLTDARGRVLAHTQEPFGASLSATANLPVIKKVFSSEESAISDLYVSTVVKRPLVAVAVPVFHVIQSPMHWLPRFLPNACPPY